MTQLQSETVKPGSKSGLSEYPLTKVVSRHVLCCVALSMFWTAVEGSSSPKIWCTNSRQIGIFNIKLSVIVLEGSSAAIFQYFSSPSSGLIAFLPECSVSSFRSCYISLVSLETLNKREINLPDTVSQWIHCFLSRASTQFDPQYRSFVKVEGRYFLGSGISYPQLYFPHHPSLPRTFLDCQSSIYTIKEKGEKGRSRDQKKLVISIGRR